MNKTVNIKKFTLIVTVLGLIFLSLTLEFYIRPSLALLLGAALSFSGLVLLLLISTINGLISWRKSSAWWLLPALMCVLSMGGYGVGRNYGLSIADAKFTSQLKDYSDFVESLKKDPAFQDSTWKMFESSVGPRLPSVNNLQQIRAIKAARCKDNGVVVVFLLDTRLPLLHEGYLYAGYSDETQCIEQVRPAKNFPYLRQVSGPWYHFSDEPGL